MKKSVPSLSDADARKRAIDPRASFIVRAPAGSGKTELLIQRYLRLLATVDEPEEVLAFTFTRKAATEMHTRILNTLAAAREKRPAEVPHKQISCELALKVLDRDDARGWGLAEQPARMRIGTIDSINSRIARRAPLSAGVTSGNQLAEYAEPLYRSAARATIEIAGEGGETADHVKQLLVAFDNRAERLETLIASMLPRRDQWMHITGAGMSGDMDAVRAELENLLGQLVSQPIDSLCMLIPPELKVLIVEVMAHSAREIGDVAPDSPTVEWRAAAQMPDPDAGSVSLWRAMAGTFLTNAGTWRKTLNKKNGFPTSDRQMRDRALELIQSLADLDGIQDALAGVMELPDPRYSDSEWAILDALLAILPLSVANLKSEFAVLGQTDYTEIAQEARAALGREDQPTELGLALDYQVRHILLDEFQDTSRTQVELLRRLTAGWEDGDGRTLFLVGDPMQSIYRFREAEVGQFIEAKENGIGAISFEFLCLEKNFRSDVTIVDWFNRVFTAAMPSAEDPSTGAIAFARSEARNPIAEGGAEVSLCPVPYRDDVAEAARAVSLVEKTFAAWRHNSAAKIDNEEEGPRIGILVRSRRHANEIVRALRTAGIAFFGADLETAEEQSIVQDLLALTRAMTHRADRLAWLAIFRAPWCGLSLQDLAALAAEDHDIGMFEILRQPPATVSGDGAKRLNRLYQAMERNGQLIGRVSLRDCVEQTWLELGGPAALTDEVQLEWAEHFFHFLDSVGVAGQCVDSGDLLNQLRKFPIDDLKGDARVEIMTIHKAKGLEFDTVILPGLGYRTRTSDRPILLSRELPGSDGAKTLFLAPLNARREKQKGIYEFLWRMEQDLEALELDRLLYVAVTRAKKRLYLFAPVRTDKDSGELSGPAAGSLLERIWPVIEVDMDRAFDFDVPEKIREDAWKKPRNWYDVAIHRLPSDWEYPEVPVSPASIVRESAEREPEEREFEWVSPWARHVGTVVHEWLQRIAEDGPAHYDAMRLNEKRDEMLGRLRRLGTETVHLERAVDRVMAALTGTLDDDDGRWILSVDHVESANEWPLTVMDSDTFQHLIIDRTFVTEDGVRWIVDYKTSTHEGGSLDDFLDSETDRYKSQLKRYRNAMSQLEGRPIRAALYFPLLKKFHEVNLDH
jgi:ATP-dependent helicase/nuclease subunit A